MLPTAVANQTVLRLRGSQVTDSHASTYTNWDSPATLTISGCSVQPVTGDEYNLGRESVTSRWNLYAPPGADLRSSDRIRHDGVDYEIDGSVQKWTDTTGAGLDHLFCLLKKVEG
jgi:hypothetical protein